MGLEKYREVGSLLKVMLATARKKIAIIMITGRCNRQMSDTSGENKNVL